MSVSVFRSALANERLLRLVLLGFIVVLLAVVVLQQVGHNRSLKETRPVYLAPDIRFGGERLSGDVPSAYVWNFGASLLQVLFYWETDGAVEYPANIDRFAAYLTPRGRASFEADYAGRLARKELSGRTRAMHPDPRFMFLPTYVTRVDNGRRRVTVRARIEETANGVPVKTRLMEYEFWVVDWPVTPNKNPVGLALDGLAAVPKEIRVDG